MLYPLSYASMTYGAPSGMSAELPRAAREVKEETLTNSPVVLRGTPPAPCPTTLRTPLGGGQALRSQWHTRVPGMPAGTKSPTDGTDALPP